MRGLFTFWNVFGLLVFVLGAFVYWKSAGNEAPGALSLPSPGEAKPETLVLVLYRPDPPRGFLKESQTLTLGPGESPEGRALAVWAEATQSPAPKALFRLEKALVVDLPAGFAQGLDAMEEAFRLYSLAYTLLTTFGAEEVRFLVEGKPSPGLAHLDLTKPIRLP
ncbi:spore gernimation protein [Thermus sp. 2.9]|uniref:GerMN domain-containing protein n=1 Tax=Thermus TaxID=270 RepID=UPI000544387F|nr:GerMN domain-containing protein [Thermus sp. 2.9]KHG65878.1 spore gernimation protein [Thermus sp. 2.9]